MTPEEFTQKFGLALPATFVKYAEKSGGQLGYYYPVDPRYKAYYAEYALDSKTRIHLAWLICLNSHRVSSLLSHNIERLRFYRDLPENYLPIGTLGNGDHILCDCAAERGSGFDCVLFWDHESGDLFEIGRTLEEFYTALTPD